MRKTKLIMTISIFTTILIILTTFSSVAADLAPRIETMDAKESESVDGAIMEEETVMAQEPIESESTQSEPAIPYGDIEPCPNCAFAVINAAIATAPMRAESILAFIDLVLSIPEYDTLPQFIDAVIVWTTQYKLPVTIEMVNQAINKGIGNLDVEAAVNFAFEVNKGIAIDLFNDLKNGNLAFPVLSSIVTIEAMGIIFVTLITGTLFVQCVAGILEFLLDGAQAPASAPGDAGSTMVGSLPADTGSTMVSGTTGSASL